MEDNPEHRRLKDEAELAKSLSQVIDHHNKEMVRIRKVERDVDRNHVQTDFTAAEKKILHVGNYRNHTLGLIAGGLTMAGLFGIARFRSSGSLRSIPVGRLKADAVRTRTYRNIDGPSSKGTATDSSSIQPGNVESADVVGTLQNMVFGAVSLIVTIVATNATFDRNAYSQGISSIPLQPGRSLFCHRACPDLLKRYQELNKQTLAYGNRPADLLKNPGKPNLEFWPQDCALHVT